MTISGFNIIVNNIRNRVLNLRIQMNNLRRWGNEWSGIIDEDSQKGRD